MEKRYQVFISSTFQDLQNARQEVSQALLRADCFPAGMELFPAADEEQFEFIKTVIDESDYYIIISAGRYGTIHPETGLSYTEMEYDYAVETGKPVIRLLHKDPFNELKGEFIEQTDEGRGKLARFRERLSGSSMVNFWSDPSDLGAQVVFGILDTRKRHPTVGWMRSDNIIHEVEGLSQRIAKELRWVVDRLDRVHDENRSIARDQLEFKSSQREFVSRLESKMMRITREIDSSPAYKSVRILATLAALISIGTLVFTGFK